MKTFCSALGIAMLGACATPIRKHDHVRITVPVASSVAATIGAEVVDVRPNGRLVLAARTRRFVDSQEEDLRLRGEVDPWAVKDHTVEVSSMMNLSVEYESNLQPGQERKVGWLMDALWPF